MNGLWSLLAWWRRKEGRRHTPPPGVVMLHAVPIGRKGEEQQEKPSGRSVHPRRGDRVPPVYLVIPPGPKGRHQRALLGLDDEDSERC